MDTSQGDTAHPTKSQKVAYYLLASIFLGSGIYFLLQGISVIWH